MDYEDKLPVITSNSMNALSEALAESLPIGPRIYVVTENNAFENDVKNSLVPIMTDHLPQFSTGRTAPILFIFDTDKFDMLEDVLRSETHRDTSKSGTESFDEIMETLSTIPNKYSGENLTDASRLELYTALIHLEQIVQSKRFGFLAHRASRIEKIRGLTAKIKDILQ